MARTVTTIEDAMSLLVKTHGESVVPEKESILGDISVIPTGITSLDYQLFIGGIPRGRITEIYGQEGSGKSSLCLEIAKQAQRVYPNETVVYIDMEGTLTGNYVESLGLDIDNFEIVYPIDGDSAFEIIEQLLKVNDVSLIVVDSVAALVPNAEKERDAGSAGIGMQARLMSSMLRRINPHIRSSNIAVIFTNQIRHKVGVMYGSPETTSGGVSLPFYATIRLRTSTSEGRKIQRGKTTIGKQYTAEIKKNKLSFGFGLFSKVDYTYLYGKGFDILGDMFDFAVNHDLIQASGSWYSWNNEEKLTQGRTASLRIIRNDDNLVERLQTLVRDYIVEHSLKDELDEDED